jgi:beta-glucosidase
VTPYDGIKTQAKDVKYAFGAAGHKFLPLLSQIVKTPDGKPGFTAKTYAEPYSNKDRKAVEEIHVEQSDSVLIDYEPPNIEGDTFYIVVITGLWY